MKSSSQLFTSGVKPATLDGGSMQQKHSSFSRIALSVEQHLSGVLLPISTEHQVTDPAGLQQHGSSL